VKTVLLVILAVLLAAAAAVASKLMKKTPAPPVITHTDVTVTSADAEANLTSSVRVRQEFVSAVVKAEPVYRPALPERVIRQRPPRQRHARATLLQRSRHLLLGDGTNRPEPFPRAR
jgi:hypothetical protein